MDAIPVTFVSSRWQAFENYLCNGEVAAMGQAEMRSGHSHRSGSFGCAAMKEKRGPAAAKMCHLNLAPAYAACDAGSEGLGSCLLGGEARCQAFRAVFLTHAIGDFARRKDAIEKTIAESIHGILYPRDFGQINARSNDQEKFRP